MRKTVHLCLSSHDEIMYRSEEDLNMGFNCLALAVLETESRLLAEGFMTTHHHNLVQTDRYKELMYRSRYAYARYFNAKYSRTGQLGEKKYFSLEVEGLHHTIAALNYALRQGLHHGLASTPFEYPHCSANAFFRKELGKPDDAVLIRDSNRYLYLPRNKSLPPDRYRMSANGLLLREDIIDTSYVEEIYITPRNFLFQMNKVSGERELEEQRKENDLLPITMDRIEAGVPDFDTKRAKIFEQGRVDRNWMTDLELCAVIDRQILPRYLKREPAHDPDGQPGPRNQPAVSIYLLPETKRADIGNDLWKESRQSLYNRDARGFLAGKNVTEAQLRRCLCL